MQKTHNCYNLLLLAIVLFFLKFLLCVLPWHIQGLLTNILVSFKQQTSYMGFIKKQFEFRVKISCFLIHLKSLSFHKLRINSPLIKMILKNKISNLHSLKKFSIYNFALLLFIVLLSYSVEFIPNKYITDQISLFCGLTVIGVAVMSLYNSIQLCIRKRKYDVNSLWILLSAIPFVLLFGTFVFEMQQELQNLLMSNCKY